jgi:hypothetical protein
MTGIAEIDEGCTPADARVLREANHALAAENDRLRHAILTLLGETDDSDYMSASEQRALARSQLVPNAQ